MLNRLRKFFSKRSYDGASYSPRMRASKSMVSPVVDAHTARRTLAARARYAVSNIPLAASGAEAWVTSLVVAGVKMQSRHPTASKRAAIAKAFEAWTDKADADGLTDFYGLQAAMVRTMVVSGEAFALLIDTSVGLRIRLLDPEQCDASYTAPLEGGGSVIQGVEFDASGNRVAYHFLRPRPGHVITEYSLDRMRIPAADVIHMFRPLWPGQVRGISFFAPILLRINDHDATRDATQVRLKIGAMLTGWIRNPDGDVKKQFDGEQHGSQLDVTMKPGTLTALSPGEEVSFSAPPAIGMDAIAFLRLTERELAAGLGIPVYLLSGDLSEVNYSSIRAGLITFRERVEALQHGVLVFQALRPIFERWATTEVLSGRIRSRLDDALPATWSTPRQAWVDPESDIKAEVLAINANLMSRRQAVSARGIDVEVLDAEIADDKRRADSLGITPIAKPANDNRPQSTELAA